MVDDTLSYTFTPTVLDFQGGIPIGFRIDVLSYVNQIAYDWNHQITMWVDVVQCDIIFPTIVTPIPVTCYQSENCIIGPFFYEYNYPNKCEPPKGKDIVFTLTNLTDSSDLGGIKDIPFAGNNFLYQFIPNKY